MDGFLRLSPDELDTALETAGRSVVLVDFDETLWLRNSTEMFLSHARPSFLAAGILRLLDLLRPWRLLAGRRRARYFRDWFRVSSILFLMPWSYFFWRRTAQRLGREFTNARLEEAIAQHQADRVMIVSNGFRILIAPLVEAMGLGDAELVAAPITHAGVWRLRGKTRAVEHVLPRHLLDSAVFITDHEDDADLLARVGTGVLCVWPDAVYERAFARAPGAVR